MQDYISIHFNFSIIGVKKKEQECVFAQSQWAQLRQRGASWHLLYKLISSCETDNSFQFQLSILTYLYGMETITATIWLHISPGIWAAPAQCSGQFRQTRMNYENENLKQPQIEASFFHRGHLHSLKSKSRLARPEVMGPQPLPVRGRPSAAWLSRSWLASVCRHQF